MTKQEERMQFNLKEIQEAIDDTATIISSLSLQRDQVSNDIKSLETYLTGMLGETSSSYFTIDSGQDGESIRYCGKRKRLMYNMSDKIDGKFIEKIDCPLIETKMTVRERIVYKLPGFLRFIADNLRKKRE